MGQLNRNWPDQMLIEVRSSFLDSVDFGSGLSEKIMSTRLKSLVMIFLSNAHTVVLTMYTALKLFI